MNSEKHKRNPLHELLEGEENLAPTHSRSSHVLESYVKIPKPASRKFRQKLPQKAAPTVEPALMREPATPAKTKEKHSQAASWEHLRKLERLSQLRAPYKRP